MEEVLDSFELIEAVQIVNSKSHTLELNVDAVRRILEADNIKDRNVVVVSIAGSLRKGKSFLLNFFLKYLKAQYKSHDVTDWIGQNGDELEGFSWRGGRHPDTIGIWIWSEIFTYDPPNDDGIAIILMDTQGIFDNQSSMKDCISTFAISMLLSSVQCYNIMRCIQEDDLQYLQLFMEYARLAVDGSDETNEKVFQNLLFLIRDWPFSYDNAYGYSEEYVKEVLAENDKQTPEMCQLRQSIESTFEQVSAFLMPHPGKSVAQEKDFKGKLEDIDDEFVKYVKILIPSILAPENLKVKQINGENVRAAEFVKYLESYVETFSGDEVPQPKSVLMATAETHIRLLHEKCLQEYVGTMKEWFDKEEGYFSDIELVGLHSSAEVKSISMFKSQRKLGRLTVSEWEARLQKAIRKKFIPFENLNKARRKTISSAKNKIMKYVAAGAAAVAAVGSIVVAGPLGLGIFLGEASIALVTAVTTGSAFGGAGLGVGLSAMVTSLLPARWFRNREIENAIEAQEVDGTVANSNPLNATASLNRPYTIYDTD
ncbi:Atlastin [Pseudolycoriella hygida]|uniref:Atlastin n=1 Tax=Pseudolycoriella hygida TaxID=35572 RepID=A0A9Q0RW56_9DIPT|nr:Atlastin [Pseudolycoriella hygida]